MILFRYLDPTRDVASCGYWFEYGGILTLEESRRYQSIVEGIWHLRWLDDLKEGDSILLGGWLPGWRIPTEGLISGWVTGWYIIEGKGRTETLENNHRYQSLVFPARKKRWKNGR
jgi:hypothetical protein